MCVRLVCRLPIAITTTADLISTTIMVFITVAMPRRRHAFTAGQQLRVTATRSTRAVDMAPHAETHRMAGIVVDSN